MPVELGGCVRQEMLRSHIVRWAFRGTCLQLVQASKVRPAPHGQGHSLTIVARYRQTVFPSREREGVGWRAHGKFPDFRDQQQETQDLLFRIAG